MTNMHKKPGDFWVGTLIAILTALMKITTTNNMEAAAITIMTMGPWQLNLMALWAATAFIQDRNLTSSGAEPRTADSRQQTTPIMPKGMVSRKKIGKG
jgi:hypothetical protein